MIKAFNKTQTKFKAEAHTCSSDNLARITYNCQLNTNNSQRVPVCSKMKSHQALASV